MYGPQLGSSPRRGRVEVPELALPAQRDLQARIVAVSAAAAGEPYAAVEYDHQRVRVELSEDSQWRRVVRFRRERKIQDQMD